MIIPDVRTKLTEQPPQMHEMIPPKSADDPIIKYGTRDYSPEHPLYQMIRGVILNKYRNAAPEVLGSQG